MFSPNPSRQNLYLQAVIHLKDGTQKIWEEPRLEDMSPIQAFFACRQRKWMENVIRENRKFLREDYAHYIYHLHCKEGEEPVQVDLKVTRQPILPPQSAQKLDDKTSQVICQYMPNQKEQQP